MVTILQTVLETYENETEELIHVHVTGEDIVTTPSHPFYVNQFGWTRAADLRAGDVLVLFNGEYVVVEFIQHEILELPVKVYNLEVEDFHTYFVGESSVLVHNGCEELRNQPGTVTGEKQRDIPQMMHGTEGNIGIIPEEVANQLKGNTYNNFDQFRSDFWKAVANSRYSNEFSQSNITRMSQGYAPIAMESQHYKSLASYVLHHKVPIHAGGAVYDLDNLVILTPLQHQDILDKPYHFGY